MARPKKIRNQPGEAQIQGQPGEEKNIESAQAGGGAPQPGISDRAEAPSVNVWTESSERFGAGNVGTGGVSTISAEEIRRAKRRGPRGDGQPRLVHDVMTPNVEVCTPDTEIYYIARMMADRNVGSIPIVENTDSMRLVGMITDRDIVVRLIAKRQDPGLMKAFDCMSSDIATIRPDASVSDCLNLMEERQVRRVPVVDNDGRCIGIVAQADLAEMMPQEQAGELVREISEPGHPGTQGAYH